MAKQTKKAKRSKKAKLPKIAEIVTPFENQKSRLSLNKSMLDVYDDKGTIYHQPTDPIDMGKWTFEFDDVEEKEENRYGRAINSGGDPEGRSEIVSSGKTEFIGSISSVINDAGASANANRAHNKHEQFKLDMEAAMRANNMNSSGMINDTKRKEHIDLIASNRNESVEQFVTKTGKHEDFIKNVKLKYEDKYDDNPTHRSKKKISDFRRGSASKQDSYNKLYPLPDEMNQIATEDLTWKDWDFIPFILHDLVNKKYLPFRSFINSVSDQSDAEWQDIRYLGRADNVQVYTGFARTLSIDFTTVAFTLEELHPMWQRLNYLVGLTKPAGYTSFANDEAVIPTSAFVIPPFVKFNLGDMYKDQPCVMTSVSLSIPQEASWELTPDGKTKNEYDFLNKTIVKSDQLVGQYPDMVQVSLSFKLLEKRLPKTNNRHFGHYRKEDDPENQDIPDDGPDIKKGFNYNLIYPNPRNPEKNMVGMDDPNEEPVDPSKKSAGGDPFEGNSDGVCTTYPPSHFYISRGNKEKKEDEKIEEELNEWKQCACEQTAKMMGLGDPDKVPSVEDDTGTRTHSLMDSMAKDSLERTGKSHVCTWNDEGCIESVNGTKVPDELKCKYNTFTTEEPTEETNPKPSKCPSPIGGLHEKDNNQRVIGYTESNEFEERKNNKEYMDGLRNRNLAYWIKDLSDYLATEMDLPKIGNGPYVYNSKAGVIPRFSQIKTVASKNGAVVLEFDANGNPFSYAGTAVNRNISKDFKIDCDEEDLNEIREIAGNLQPKVIIDTESNFRIVLDEERGHVITKDNYDNVEGIKRWLASWVSSEMRWVIPSANEPEGRTTWKDSFLNLKGKWADDVWTEYDIYYAPYEEDAEKQVTAYKVFPGTSQYVNYEVDTNISENLGLDGGGPKYAELKFGFYAIVAKKKEKLSTRDPDRWFEQDLADKLYEKFFVDMNHIVGGASQVGSENTGLAGDGTELQSDESSRDFLNPTNSNNEEKLLLLKEKKATEARVDAQLLNENIICIDYTLVGKWNPTQASEIMSRMKNISYQPIIKQKRQIGASRIEIENYVLLLLGTSDEDIEAADFAYQTASQKGRLIREDRELARFTEQDFLQAEIETLEAEMAEDEANNNDEFAEFKHGVFFSSRDSESHYDPWVRDHKYDKIDWKDGSNTLPDDPRPGRKPKVIGEPRPTTESPTPNTRPTWKWKPVESAIQYEVEFPPGILSLTSNNFFKPTDEFPSLKKLEYKTYTIKVKAGRRAHGSGEMEWSGAGTHTVVIDQKAIPTKPPRCPYKVMDVGEKDEHGRLIGPATYDEPFEKTIERNVKTWMGDVMAYIIANEDMGVLEYPANPESIVWNTNEERAISMSGRNQLEWTYNGNTISNLGFDNDLQEIAEPGFPTKLNGTPLGVAENGSMKYANEFDCGCGPSLQTDGDSGSNTSEPADLELEVPKPSSNETTTNMKPKWTWKSIRGANMYEVSLRKGKANYNADGTGNAKPWTTEEDYGIIQFSDLEEANPPFSLDIGTYEIGVTALYQENGQVTKKSFVGTHIVKVIGGGTPTPTPTPTPTGEYMKLIKDAFVGNNAIYVNDRSCIQVGGTITINRKDKQEEAIVTGFSPRQKVTANATGLGSWGYNYTTGNDPVQLTLDSKSDQIARMIVDILKLRSDVNCSESDLNSIKDCTNGENCKFASFEKGIARFNNDQLSKLYSSLETALSASIGRGSSDLPAGWFFSSAKTDTKPFGVSADLIAYDSNIFGSQLKDILDTAIDTHRDDKIKSQTATGEGIVLLQSGLKSDHKKHTHVVCGNASPTPTPTPIEPPTPTPIKNLKTPKPNTQSPTNNLEVTWSWVHIDNATEYEIVTRKLNETNTRTTIVSEESHGSISDSLFKITFEESGLYEIGVTAKNAILKVDSDEGTHTVLIDEEITPTPIPPLDTPRPNAKTPTSDTTLIWNWEAVQNATRYKIELNEVEKSTNVATGVESWDIKRKIGRTKFTTSQEYDVLLTTDGFYEITVIALNDEMESEPGTHVVELNSELTPTPTPTPTITTTISPSESDCDAFVYGNDLYLEQESGYCPDNDESALTRWWTRAIEYCVCKWWNNQPQSVRESKGLYRIYNFPFSVSAYTNEFSVKLEDFHNPQNITASSPIKRSANYGVQVQFKQGKFPSKQGFENIPWSELYPYWKAKGFTRFDSSKGEQCPFSEPKTPTPTTQFECPEIISDLNEFPGYCPNPSDEVALEYWKQVIKYGICKGVKERFGESAYVKSFNFSSSSSGYSLLHNPESLGRTGSNNWLPFKTTCTIVKPDGTTQPFSMDQTTKWAQRLIGYISPIKLTGSKIKCKELNSTPTPSPTPIASAENPFVLPSFYLDQVDGICENTESMKNDWYAAVAKWVVAEDYLENFPSYIIRTAIPSFSGTSTGLDKPNDLKEWPAMIKLKYYNRDTKSEEESEVSYSEVNSLAKQNGFGLSDPSKSLTELCNSGPAEFGNFLEEIEGFSRDKAYKDGDKVFYPTANKNAFFNSFDNEDRYLTLQEGISKYSNDPNFTIYQVHWEDYYLTRFIDSNGRPTTENKVPPVNLVILSDQETDNSLKSNGYTESQIIKWKLSNPDRNVRDTPNTSRFWLSNTSKMKPKSEAVRKTVSGNESEDF